MKIRNAVICAAGLGSRLGLDKPKCLVEINDNPLIYYILEILKQVENVRIVVGFKEEEVINVVRKIREDVVFVRNPDYRNTTNAYSLYLGSYDLQDSFINIDGDMYLEEEEYLKFVDAIKEDDNLIAYTKSYTEDAVYVNLNSENQVTQFSRDKISNYEWTGIAYFSTIKIAKEGKYIYQELEDKLPINGIEISCYEIDTQNDLEVLYQKLNA
jgi:choline kinase